MVNPLKSKRFLVMLLDAVISIILHFWGGADVQFLIVTLQPIFIFLIGAYAVEDVALVKRGL